MAATGSVTVPHSSKMDAVLAVRLGIIAFLLVTWQVLSMSGLLYEDVVPGLP